MNNEKMISAILNDIEYGIRETEKMIRDIDTEFKKLNDNLAINKQTEKQEVFERGPEKIQVSEHLSNVVELQCELWKNHSGNHFFNSFSIGGKK